MKAQRATESETTCCRVQRLSLVGAFQHQSNSLLLINTRHPTTSYASKAESEALVSELFINA